MIDKPLQLITEPDLAALIATARTEGRTLDFKATFPGTTERAVKNFLADVTALANTDGGDIVIGMAEDGNATARELVGVPADGLDAALLRIEDQLRNCVDPRIPGFRVHTVPLANGNVALILRIQASLIGPHRVTFQTSRFYGRNSRGNFEMSTGELRLAFAATEELPRKIRDLHTRAIEAAGGRNMPCRVVEGPIAILTVAPMSVLREARDIRTVRENACLPPLTTAGIEMVVGLDGLIVHSSIDRDTQRVQAWSANQRRGYLDFAWSIGRVKDGQKIIWRKYFDQHLVGAVRGAITRLREHGIEGPWIAMVTLIGIEGYGVITGDGYLTSLAWQDPAYLGEVIDDYLEPGSLTPLIDGFWRLFGIDHAPAWDSR